MYWLLLDIYVYSENFGFGLGGFIISRTFNNRMKGLSGTWNIKISSSGPPGFIRDSALRILSSSFWSNLLEAQLHETRAAG